jgi:RES domain-containing protein
MASSESWITGYRIVAPRWRDAAFSGEGAAKYGGRWNSPGHGVVYLAGSRALAALEMLVHLTSPASRAKNYLLFEVHIPADSVTTTVSRQGNSRSCGDAWLASARSAALQVPSVLIPEERNVILALAHPDMSRCQIGKPREFTFDERL